MGRGRVDAVARFAQKIAATDNGCIEWIAGVDKNGYGKFHRGGSGSGRSMRAHRWSYELHFGPIPTGLVLDHLCRNPACVNPEHLEPVTNRENLMRGDTPAARQLLRTHCPTGHPYAGANLYLTPTGRRVCRECARVANRKWYARQRASA